MFRRGTKGLEVCFKVGWFRSQAQRRLHGVQTRSGEASGRTQATTHSGGTGVRARGCAATARRVARDPAARKAAQIKVRSKFYAKNVEAAKFSKLALAEELATLGGCEPIYPLCKETWSAPAYIAELRLRHVELDFAISPALDRTFKKVNDAITRGLGPAKKAPEVKLSAIQPHCRHVGCVRGRCLRGLSALVTSSR